MHEGGASRGATNDYLKRFGEISRCGALAICRVERSSTSIRAEVPRKLPVAPDRARARSSQQCGGATCTNLSFVFMTDQGNAFTMGWLGGYSRYTLAAVFPVGAAPIC